MILLGGVQADNIFWQVAEEVDIGTTAHFEGNILCKTGVTFKTKSTMIGRILAQTAVALQMNTMVVSTFANVVIITDSPTTNTSSPTTNTSSPTVRTSSPTTKMPVSFPTSLPTKQPTKAPTALPTALPTAKPTKQPTDAPTKEPTKEPTKAPTKQPTQIPTVNGDTFSPTVTTKEPTKDPTKEPTKDPTKQPTDTPTKEPTKEPTKVPTKQPTQIPTVNGATFAPTVTTKEPTKDPTKEPTKDPTKEPTAQPTAEPTKQPTAQPTKVPTAPTKQPTNMPTANGGTFAPTTKQPTPAPTSLPTPQPTLDPTPFPLAMSLADFKEISEVTWAVCLVLSETGKAQLNAETRQAFATSTGLAYVDVLITENVCMGTEFQGRRLLQSSGVSGLKLSVRNVYANQMAMTSDGFVNIRAAITSAVQADTGLSGLTMTMKEVNKPLITGAPAPAPAPGVVATTKQPTAGAQAPAPAPVPRPPTTPAAVTGGGFVFAGCNGGSGSFSVAIEKSGEPGALIGTIPMDQVGLNVNLKATTRADLDLRIYDPTSTSQFAEGKAIVAWCSEPCNNGAIGGNSAIEVTSGTYAGMDITYSGVNGVNFNFGEEYISIAGKTTVPIVMKAFAYEAGAVDVTYSWTRTVSSCCLGTAACTSSFVKTVSAGEVTTLGDIPAGVSRLEIYITTTGADLDIQLFDKGNGGNAIIGYGMNAPNGMGDNIQYMKGDYRGRTYHYSGFNGVDGMFGNEFVKIDGVTNTELTMKVLGFTSGEGTITYSYYWPQ
jgi:hypothetical protein